MVPTKPDFMHHYRLEFLSNYIAELVALQVEMSGVFTVERTNDSSWAASLVGILYKMRCHSKIEGSTGLLSLRFRALARNSAVSKYTLTIPTGVNVVAFDTLDEIKEIPDGTTYYKPKAKSFGAVDAFILVSGGSTMCYGLKMTINRDCGIDASALRTFRAFLERLQITNFSLNFVVPQVLAADFLTQSSQTKSQLHGENDAHSNSPDVFDIPAQFVASLDVL